MHLHVPGDRDTYSPECIVGLVGQDRIVVTPTYGWEVNDLIGRGTIVAAAPADDGGLHLTVRLDQAREDRLADMLAKTKPPEGHRRRFGMGFRAERADLVGEGQDYARVFHEIRVHQLSPEPGPLAVRLG